MNNRDIDKIKLTKFKLKTLLPNATILILGRRRSGKSVLIKDIFHSHRNIPRGIIFSGTEEANPFFGDFIPDSFIHSKYDTKLIESILQRQAKKIRKAKDTEEGKHTNGCTEQNRFFLVLDDLLQDANQWKRDDTIKTVFFNGRHYNIFFILAMQYPMGITPDLRSNIDYVFVFNEPNIENKKKIYKEYGGMIPSFDHFCNILDICTENFGCLVLKLTNTGPKLNEQVFFYKADIHDDFKVGHPKIWEYHDKNYNNNHQNENDDELEEIRKKYLNTKRLKVIVSKSGEIVNEIPQD